MPRKVRELFRDLTLVGFEQIAKAIEEVQS